MPNTILEFIELFGTASFAVSGALAAMEKRLDPFGVIILAFVTAIGGGTVRDLLLGQGPVSWLYDVPNAIVIIVAALLTLLFTKRINRLSRTLSMFDALGLGLFTLIGLEKGQAAGLAPGFCVALGTITGCFGGVIRDVILIKIPLIFRQEIYASASIAGGMLYLLTQPFLDKNMVFAICIGSTVAIRFMAIRYQWKLPTWYGGPN